jgi:SNW domain-containing protein 1
MATISSLSKALPKPKYTGDEEELPSNARSRGPRIVTASDLDSQVALRRAGPPPYGQRTSWRPRGPEDFGDGGAFPEVPVAQYPLGMGQKSSSKSNALAIQVDSEGKVKYDAIARRGHSESRIIHSSFKDLIPLRQRADVGEISLDRPSEEEVQATKERTQAALAALVSNSVAATKPKQIKVAKRETTYVRYTPTQNQMGDYTKKQDRIVKIVNKQQDPLEPAKWKNKKIPGGPPSPPPPVMHSPPRKLTAEDQENWRIPPAISNWKNPKGFTVPLDKRLATDGRGLQDVVVNDKFAQFADAMATADRHAREEVAQRALMQQKLAEKEKQQKEEHLRMLAQKAREERNAATRRARSPRSRSVSESEHSDSGSDEAAREREEARRERRREAEKQLRQSRMGAERRLQMMAREQGRDISEKIALGLAKPSASGESMYDSRLFNQSSGFAAGFNEDQPYDKPLFAAQEALSSIYRPKVSEEDDGEGADEAMERIEKSSKRFEGFHGSKEAEVREGPVQFERDRMRELEQVKKAQAKDDDPFGIDDMISEVTGGKAGKRKFGLNEREDKGSKKARVSDDDD